MRFEYLLATVILSILLIAGLWLTAKCYRHRSNSFPLKAALLAMYLLVNVISGIVHFLNIDDTNRGYYDAVKSINASNGITLLSSIFITVLGFFSLYFGLLRTKNKKPELEQRKRQQIHLQKTDKKITAWLSLLFFPPSIYSVIVLNSFIEEESLRRVVALTDGMARFGFMAHWFTWATAFLCLWFYSNNIFRSSLSKAALLLISVFAIFWSLRWTGGRTVGVLMSLPLIIVMFQGIKRFKLPLAALMATIAVLYSIFLTLYRKENYSDSQFSLIGVLDWELGKFSMLPFSIDYTSDHGYLLGETLYAAVFSIPLGVIKAIGLSDLFWIPRYVTNITGEAILGNPDLIYIVPGLSSELYMNFGALGIGFGYFLLGRFATWVDLHLSKTQTPTEQLVFSYIAVITIFCSISAQSAAFFGYLFYSGLPLLLALGILKIQSIRYKARHSC